MNYTTGTKVCNRCGLEKTLDHFTKIKGTNRYRCVCHECRRIEYQEHRGECIERSRRYYQNHREEITNKSKERRRNNIVVSHRANTIKNDATIEELRKVLEFYEKIIKSKEKE